MHYKQLTQEQRYQIYALVKAGQNQTQIARIVGVHKASISREVRRNRGRRGYRPKQAHQRCLQRRQAKVSPRITPATWQQVRRLLGQQWSPEQISGRLRLEGQDTLSHERIYQYIYADKQRGGTLYRHLRCQKVRRKRYGRSDRRGQLSGRRSIEARPKVVAAKRRRGDWEADTIIGRGHRGAIVSLVERRSKLTRLQKVKHNTAELVGQAMRAQLAPLTVHTITSDNGREFAGHEETATHLKVGFYFAHPFASWERGLNENTNGLVRQYFPKKFDFSKITEQDIQRAMERLNDRPRKTLGYKTPNEVFFKRPLVALTS